MMKSVKFYILSFTWGLLMTSIGIVVGVILLCAGKKPKRWGDCFYFEVGEGWGGLELGIVFLTSKNPPDQTKNHEHGHAIQNCRFGPLMPFIVSIPSAIRYWYRLIRARKGLPNEAAYDDIWFEGQATELGTKYLENYKTRK